MAEGDELDMQALVAMVARGAAENGERPRAKVEPSPSRRRGARAGREAPLSSVERWGPEEGRQCAHSVALFETSYGKFRPSEHAVACTLEASR